MKRVEKIRMVLLCLSVLTILGVLGVAFRERKRPVVISSEKAPGPSFSADVVLKNVSYSTVSSSNFKEWDLTAQSARLYENEKRVVLEDVTVRLYSDDGKIYRLEGKKGEFNTQTRNIKIRGGTKGEMPDGTTIKTESFFYDHGNRTITSDAHVVITRNEYKMEGVGMVADLNSETLKILKNVKALGN